MANIYEQSYLTISASTAPDSNSGFLVNREQVRLVKYIQVNGSPSAVHTRTAISHLQLYNLSSPVEPKDRYLLYTRAWCFQERLLARRILHFLRSEVVFECRSGLHCECGDVNEEHGSTLKSDFAAINKTNTNPTTDPSSIPYDSKDPQEFWRELVREYTDKNLTFSHDKLPALSGIASRMPAAVMGSYVAGLWERDILRQLVWYVPSYVNVQWRRHTSYVAPSFSWASIDGPVLWKDWYLWQRSPTKVLEVRCERKGIDPTGEVLSAYIMLSGALITVRIINRNGSAFVERSGSSEKLALDIPSALPSLEGEFINCFRLFTNHGVMALALRRSCKSEGAYECIGLIQKASESWFHNAYESTVTII